MFFYSGVAAIDASRQTVLTSGRYGCTNSIDPLVHAEKREPLLYGYFH